MKRLRIVYIAFAALLLCNCYDHQVSELGMASANGNLEKVQQLVASGVNINGCSGYEGCDRPIEAAAMYGHLDVVRYLVEHGAKINVASITNAVYKAAHFGKADVVHYLLSKGGHLICDKAALASLKRDMAAKGWTQLYAEVEKTWSEP